MKRLFCITAAVILACSTQAIDRAFTDGYTIARSRINTDKEEFGLSLLEGKLAFSRNDTVYVAELGDSFDIKSITPMPDLSALKIEGQFAHNGKTIIFSKGGELYMAEKVNKQWSNPQKLNIDGMGGGRTEIRGTSLAARRWTYKRPVVKGMYNPALSKNGKKLYYVAEFEGGQGGTDIWYSVRKPDGKSWTAPKNMGTLVNSPSNEDYPFPSGDTAFYFSSTRNDTLQGMNIYKTNLKSSAEMLRADFNSNSNDGNLVVANGCPFLISQREGNVDIYRPQLLPPVVEAAPDTMAIDTTPINIVRKDYNTCIFYFDYDKTTLIDQYEKEFAYIYDFVKSNPESKFAINGHTDTRGTDEYNQTLSTNRAKVVYDRLIQMGIEKERLSYQGFGKSQPEITDAKTEEEHQKNRRVVIIKLD